MSRCVYLVGASNGLTRIGWTTNIKQRLSTLGTSSPFKLHLLHVIETEQAPSLERRLHEQFKASRNNGEWFSLTPGEIEAMIATYPPPPAPPPPPPPEPEPEDRPMTVTEAADYLQLSTETIRRMLREGRLRGSQPAGRRGGWRVRRIELDRLAAPGTEQLPHPAVSADRRAALLRQAERARARGDDEGAARFETIASGMARADSVD